MSRPVHPLPSPWSVRLRDGQPPRHASPGSGTGQPAARPGIAARWKPRDRVRAAGN